MQTLYRLYHLMRADFFERTRRQSFVVVLCLVVFLGYSVTVEDIVMRLGKYKGELNAAWAGASMAAVSVSWLTLIGFYLVKNSLARDAQTGVGQILAATPLTKVTYLLGKMLSHWAYLAALVGILVVGAVVFLGVHPRDCGGRCVGLATLDVGALIAPFVFLVLPTLALVAGVAVLFESVGWLRGGLGNIVYIFAWASALAFSLEQRLLWADWTGLTTMMLSLQAAAHAKFPEYREGFQITLVPTDTAGTFFWPGIVWTPEILLQRASVLVAALGLTLVASVFFDRFNRFGGGAGAGWLSWLNGWAMWARIFPARPVAPAEVGLVDAPVHSAASLPVARRGNALSVLVPAVVAELRLMLKGHAWWWYLGVLGLIVAPAGMTPAEARYVLLAAWVWPVLVWSALGMRAAEARVAPILYACPHPLARQVPAEWIAGVCLAAVCGSGVAWNFVTAGAWLALGAWGAAVLFIPALALALGVWSGGSKLFEVVYMMLWYIGPLHAQDVPQLDFMGVGDGALALGVPWAVLVATGLCLLAAFVGRQRQLRK